MHACLPARAFHLAQLCEALKSNTTIISLDLSANSLTDEGRRVLCLGAGCCVWCCAGRRAANTRFSRCLSCLPCAPSPLAAAPARLLSSCTESESDYHMPRPALPCPCPAAGAKALAAALGDGRAPDLIDLNLSDNPGVLEEGTAALVRQRRRPPAALRRVWEDGGRGMGPRV